MGFGEEELNALKRPELISVLLNASVSWCSVSINRDVVKRLLQQAQDAEKEIAFVDRMLRRSEEHTSELQSLMRISYAVFCLKKKNIADIDTNKHTRTRN